MELRRDLLIGIGALAVLNILIAFGAIGLFTRMGPAIGRILEENVYSLKASEEMLAILASLAGKPAEPETRQDYLSALKRMRDNVTEADEAPVIERISARSQGTLEGDGPSLQESIRDLRLLGEINRQAMRRVDQEAQRLGAAGAWVAVFIAVLAFLLSALVVRRIHSRILEPFTDLYQVLEAARSGDPYRRCQSAEAPLEVKRIQQAVNALLDERPVDDFSPRSQDARAANVEV